MVVREINYFQYATEANTCPKCGSSLTAPYFPHGFDSVGIVQCTACDYNIEVNYARKHNSTKI